MAVSMTWPQYLRQECTVRGHRIHLPPKQLDMLLFLMLHKGKVVQRDSIVDFLWPGADGGPLWAANMIDVYLVRLRRTLGKHRFETMHGRGILFHG